MRNDPVIERIRNARKAISEKCGHDPKRLIEYYLERQKIKNESEFCIIRKVKNNNDHFSKPVNAKFS